VSEPKRVLVVHLYRPNALAEILARLKAGKRPPETEVFLGSYGIRHLDATLISDIGAHYAPTFHLGPAVNVDIRSGRHDLPKDTPPFDNEFAGEFPVHPDEPWLPREKPRAWGFEIGRRFRDQLRAEQKIQPLIENWQLDEIPRECAIHPTRRADFRLFVGGVVRGLAEGRPKLGDKLLPGFVWIGAGALEKLPGAALTSDVQFFWQDVNVGARYLIGEEYPTFLKGKGAATAAANAQAKPQKALAAPGSKPRQALAKKYVVGMTPGWHNPEDSGLNGNIGGALDLAGVASWRKEFIKARTKAQRPCGYGMFHFDGDFNTVPVRVKEAIDALTFAATKHAAP
jgi:hypothetical protein